MDEPRPCSSMLSDLENRGCGMVESKSFLDSTRRMVEPWLRFGCVAVEGRLKIGLASRRLARWPHRAAYRNGARQICRGGVKEWP